MNLCFKVRAGGSSHTNEVVAQDILPTQITELPELKALAAICILCQVLVSIANFLGNLSALEQKNMIRTVDVTKKSFYLR